MAGADLRIDGLTHLGLSSSSESLVFRFHLHRSDPYHYYRSHFTATRDQIGNHFDRDDSCRTCGLNGQTSPDLPFFSVFNFRRRKQLTCTVRHPNAGLHVSRIAPYDKRRNSLRQPVTGFPHMSNGGVVKERVSLLRCFESLHRNS